MKTTVITLMLGWCLVGMSNTQTNLVNLSDTASGLPSGWQTALDQAPRKGRVWIGYEIEVPVLAGSFHFSSWSINSGTLVTRGISMDRRLAGETTPQRLILVDEAPRRPFASLSSVRIPMRLAMMFQVRAHPKPRITAVRAVDMRLPFQNDGQKIYWLGRQSVGQSWQHLRKHYAPSSPTVQRRMLVQMGFHDTADTFKFLAGIAKQHENSETRREAVEALARMSHPQVVSLISDLARVDDIRRVRTEALEALAYVGTHEAMKALFTFRDDPVGEIREEVLSALADFDHQQARDTVYHLFRKDTDEDVVEEALEIIAEEFLDHELVVRVALGREPSPARRDAIELLELLEPEEAAEHLQTILKGKESTPVRRTAVEVLGDLPQEISQPQLFKIAERDTDEEVRLQAVESLGNHSGTAVVSHLRRLALRGRGQIAEEAVEALGEIEERSATDALIEIAEKHPSGEIRDEALDQLSERVFSR